MAAILITTNCLSGMLYSSVELARRLAAAGHRVVYAGLPHARATVELQGLTFVPVEPSAYPAFVAADSKRGKLDRLRNLDVRQAQAIEAMQLEAFIETVRQIAPDLLLVDGELTEQVIALQPLGIPTAVLNTFISIWRAPGLPPPSRLGGPGHEGWRGSPIAASLWWSELRLRRFQRNALRNFQRVGCDRLSLLKRLARENGVNFSRFTDDRQWLQPVTFRNLPALSLHGLELEFPHTPPSHVRYLGPLPLKRRADPQLDPADQARLNALFEQRKASPGTRKIIYGGFGSFFTSNAAFLQKLFAAVDAQPDWDLILSLGGRIDPAELGPTPDRVHAFRWLPQLAVLPHAAAAVVHGGVNTIDECILHAVPMLVYCGYETDMAGNTSRVVYHQIGLAGDPKTDNAHTIAKHLHRLLTDPVFTQKIQSIQTAFQAYEQNQTPETTIAALLRSRAT